MSAGHSTSINFLVIMVIDSLVVIDVMVIDALMSRDIESLVVACDLIIVSASRMFICSENVICS